MESIKDRVAIIGMGCTQFGELWEKSDEDLVVEACHEAFKDAGIEPKEVQAGWYGTTLTGFTGMRLAQAIKLEYVPITRVENLCCTATDALRNACYAVAAGIYDIVLACGVEKQKDSGYAGVTLTTTGPDDSSKTEIMLAVPVLFALSANRYFHRYGITPEEGKLTMAKIAVKNHHNGTLSPKAHFRREVSIEGVLNAPMVAYPLGLYDCCGLSDGAAAAIITRPEIAKTLRDDYVLVKGLGLTCGARQGVLQDNYDLTHFEETVTAARMAYNEAGIKNPRNEVDLAIVHDCFSITEMIIYEDLGFSPRGKAKEDVDKGTFTLQGELPVNTDGGLKCFGHPIGASGLRMIYEVYKQLQDKAGPRQTRNAGIGLTHNLGGAPGSFTCAVSILGRRG